ncbi:hypothetical protein PT974_03881 [Cladobotryum mycophilum]|uniref:MARVEL domain-containing protein n=1 Tax=Cladobotryum mycophilum TaxID=491253 RepID=A0ABR0STJ0_9HYPO
MSAEEKGQQAAPQVISAVEEAPAVQPTPQPGNHDLEAAPRAQTNPQVVLHVAQELNPVTRLYDHALNAGGGRWLCSIIVLGLSAGIISKHPPKLLLAASAFNLAVACLHFLLMGPLTRPRSPTDARPPNWYIILLLASTLLWIAAMSFIFAAYSDWKEYAIVDLHKRVIIIDIANGAMDILENITVACGCFSVSAFICCFAQWIAVYRISYGKFSEQDIAQSYETEAGTKKVNRDS